LAATTNAQIATALPGFTLRNQALVAFSQTGVTPPATQSSTSTTAGYGCNAAFSASTANRILGNAGATGVGATAIEPAMTNNSGAALTSLNFSYDFVALSEGTAQSGGASPFRAGNESELPGYRVFFSLLGSAGPWKNISGLNFAPVTQTLTGFTTTVSASSVAIGSWTTGSTLTLRWFKDNENHSSPDPLYGTDNVSVVPTPGAIALLCLGGLAAGRRRR